MYLVFDTEAKEVADDFLNNGISYLAFYRSDTDKIEGYFEPDVKKFLDDMNAADEIIGYNIYGYDFPVLKKYFSFDLSKKRVIDLYKIIADTHNVYLKLDNISQATLGNAKIAHGLDAVRFYKEGNLDKLKEYCDMDVQLTKDVYEFIKKNRYFYYVDGLGNKIKLELDLDTAVKDVPKVKDSEDGLSLF